MLTVIFYLLKAGCRLFSMQRFIKPNIVNYVYLKRFATSCLQNDFEFECSSSNVLDIAQSGLKVFQNFITTDEEKLLLHDIELRFRRLKYEESHWDNAIQNYRESENVRWSKDSNVLIAKMKAVTFKDEDVQKSAVHVLDLSPSGYIMPHVDSVKFCGRVICGLSLLSPCIMRFVKTDDSKVWFKAVLNRRSLYVMSDSVRYDFTHEVLKDSESYIHDKKVDKGRRISVLCRSEPPPTQLENSIFEAKVISIE